MTAPESDARLRPGGRGADAGAGGARGAEILSVTQLNRRVADLLESGLPILRIQGEVSNLVRAASGHWYFSLKDPGAQVRAVMFRGRAQYVSFVLREGMQVEVRAQATLYPARGDFQLIVDSMRQAGAGDLYQQFVQLKDKLQREGLFEPSRKRPVPQHPSAIGVITSATGAALHDVLTTLQRRAPAIPVFIYPSLVQGADAPARLIAALSAANAHAQSAVLLLVRGGGSIEDLWAFNDEKLARAIAASRIPVVSGVGHETDFTIADFVADLRAPTPTGAAAMVSPDRRDSLARLRASTRALAHAWHRQSQQFEQMLDYSARLLRPPSAQWRERSHRVLVQADRLRAAARRRCELEAHHLERVRARLTAPKLELLLQRNAELGRRMYGAFSRRQERAHDSVASLAQRLQSSSPEGTLARGYAIVQQQSGQVVRSTAQVSVGEPLAVLLGQGALSVRVEERS